MATPGSGSFFATLVATSIDQAEVRDNGGDIVAITGQFLDAEHTVAIITPDGEVPCYMGSSGEGNSGRPVSPTCLTFASPPLSLGTGYAIVVRSGAQEDYVFNALASRNRSFGSADYGTRQLFAPFLRLGPRDLDVTDPLDTTPIDASEQVSTAAFGLRLAHQSTIDGIVRTPTMITTGDPLLVYVFRGAVAWAAHWTTDTNGGAVPPSFLQSHGIMSEVKVLPDGAGVICVGNVVVSKTGGQQTVEIRNGDGTIFKTFDTLAANPEDQCGIGNDGGANNTFIARYDRLGNCQWVKRIGHNQAARNGGDVGERITNRISVDVANGKVQVIYSWATLVSVAPFGNVEFGIGESNNHVEGPQIAGQRWSADVEFDLATGEFTGELWIDRVQGNIDAFLDIAGRVGNLSDGNPYLSVWTDKMGSLAANTVDIDRDRAGATTYSIPNPVALQFSSRWEYGNPASGGPDWIATLTRPSSTVGLFSLLTRKPLLGAAFHYLSHRYDDDFAGDLFDWTSTAGLSQTGLSFATSLTSSNHLLTRLRNDGLSAPVIKAVHKRTQTAPAAIQMAALNEALGIVVVQALMPSGGGDSYEFDPELPSPTTITSQGVTGDDAVTVFLDAVTLEYIDHVHSVGVDHRSDGSPDGFGYQIQTAAEELLNIYAVTDANTIIDGVAQDAPAGGEIMYLGHYAVDLTDRSVSTSGKIFAIGTVNTAAGILTAVQAFDAVRD